MKSSLPLSIAIFAASCSLSALTALSAEENWARFGGSEGNGRSAETALPVKWDAASVAWKVKLKGEG